jgi:hypothetical protein
VRLVAFGVLATLATSCAPPDATDLSTATQPVIVGHDDLTYVGPSGSVPSRYNGLYPSIGHFRKRDINDQGAHYTGCTASYIGRGVAMTAGHCFDAPTSEARDKLCHGTDVEWALIEGQGPLFRSACQRILRAKDDDAGTDYAFFEVFPPPTRALTLDTSMGRTSPGGGNATLFSHPDNRSLMWSGTCPITTPYGSIFPHRCDMEGGSSGAPILRDDTLAVVGINLGDDGATLNYGRFLGATPAATVLSERAAWGGVTVTSARTTQRCGAVLQSRDDTYAFIQTYNGLRTVSAGLPASSGCSFASVSVSYQCAGAGSVYNAGTNDTTRPFVTLSCPSGLTEAPPYWTSFQSEEHGGPATTCDGWTGNHEPTLRAIDGVACSGSYCDNVSVRCPGTIRAPITGAPFWTAFFSEEQPARFCPAGSYVTGLRCSGSNCDNISLRCAPSSRPWGTCTQLPAFSEEQVSSTCPSGTHVTGMRCTGRYCDNIALTCC